MKTKFFLFLLLSLYSAFPLHAQLTGGNGNGQSPTDEVKAGEITSGSLSGDVNLFTGTYNSSYALGGVATPSGLQFGLQLSYNSNFATGDNLPHSSGMPYGEGWSLGLPTISVSTEDYHKYTLAEVFEINQNEEQSDYTQFYNDDDNCGPASTEGRLYWFSPTLNIPGQASGRLVFKEKRGTKYLFVLHAFERYVEAWFDGNETWEVILDDGMRYVLGAKMIAHRNASNQRVEAPCNDDDAIKANLYLPKSEILSWYCDRIYHANLPGNIYFEYDRYGCFDFFGQYTENINRQVLINNRLLGLAGNAKPALGSVNQACKEIILKRVYSETEELLLDYENILTTYIDPADGENLLVPGVDGAEFYDEMYTRQEVADWYYGDELSDWTRYLHVKSPELNLLCVDDYTINPTNPYRGFKSTPSLNEPSYVRQSAGVGKTYFGIPFRHGFLQSPRISASTHSDNMPAGDIYQVQNLIGNTGNTALEQALFDVNLATGDYDFGTTPIYLDGTNQMLPQHCYNKRYGDQVFSTHNQAVKWLVSDYELATSNFFTMPNLPNQYRGFNIQIGLANSDTDHGFNFNCPPSGVGSPDVCATYFNNNGIQPNHLPGNIMESGASIPYNFGVGLPWFSLRDDYSAALSHCANTAAIPFWWNDRTNHPNESGDGCDLLPGCTWPSVPTKAPIDANGDGLYLKRSSVFRYAKNPYMLSKVVKKVHNARGGFVTVSQVALRYDLQKVRRFVTAKEGLDNSLTERSYSKDQRNIFRLTKIRQLPIGAADFADAPAAPTTHLEYTEEGPWDTNPSCDFSNGCDQKLYNSNFSVLQKITDPLGKETLLEYYPLGPVAGGPTPGQGSYSIYSYYYNLRPQDVRSAPVTGLYCLGTVNGNYTMKSQANPYAFQTYMVVKSKTVKDKDFNKVWNYSFSGSVQINRRAPTNNQFNWDSQLRVEGGFAQATVVGPTDGTSLQGPSRSIRHHTESLLFGKVKGMEERDFSGALLSETEFQYEMLKAFEAPWLSATAIDHPDMQPLVDQYEAPYFYETRFAAYINDNYADYLHSFFIKMTRQMSTSYDNGGSMTTTTEYDYFDADVNLMTTSPGYAAMGISSPLTQEPSWKLYRKRTDYPHANAYTIEENFYLYDLLNKPGLANGGNPGGYLLTLRDHWKMRHLPIELRVTSKGPDDVPITQSSYSVYSTDWADSPADQSLFIKYTANQVSPGTGALLGLNYSGTADPDLSPVFPYDILVARTIESRGTWALPVLESDEKGLMSQTLYNSVGLPERSIIGYGLNDALKTTYAYDAENTIQAMTDPNGTFLEFSYDEFLRLREKHRNGKLVESITYSNWGNEESDSFASKANQNFVATTFHVSPTESWTETNFVDPLGRPAASTKDGVKLENPIYDLYDRPVLQIKPTGGAGPDYSYTFPNPDHQETIFDVAPRSRALKVSKYGESVYGSHLVEQEYAIVTLQHLAFNVLAPAGVNDLPAGDRFYSTKITDEDGKEMWSYTNQLGQEVATVSKNGEIATVLHYNSHGTVKKVINPKEQVSEYTYNYLGQLFEQQTPDGGTTYFAYNPSGQVIAESHPNGQYRAIEYDLYGRPTTQSRLQTVSLLLGNQGMFWVGNNDFYQDLHALIHASAAKYEKRFFYTNYDEANAADLEANALDYLDNSLTHARGRLVQSISYDLEGNVVEHRFNSYNIDGFVKWEMMQLKIPEERVVRIDYREHNLLGSPYKQNVDLNGDASLDFQYRYRYDSWNRLESVFANYNDPDADDGNLIVHYQYDDIKGVVATRNYYDNADPEPDGSIADACRNTPIQETIYTYDDRFRLTSIKSDLFKSILYYDDQVNPSHTDGATYNYNGNINGAQFYYGIQLAENGSDADIMGGKTHYNYEYDDLNRLLKANAQIDNTVVNLINPQYWGDATFDYDKVGNLEQISRGIIDGQAVFMDDYIFHYAVGNNRLMSVDESLGSTRNFFYDGSGNMTSDSKKGMTVDYGRANLPWDITRTDANGQNISIAYRYNAADQRIVKSVDDNSGNKTEYYLRTGSGQDLAVYDVSGNTITWYVQGLQRVAKIEQSAPAFTKNGGDQPDTCDPNPPDCKPQAYNLQQAALPALRSHLATRTTANVSLPTELYRIRLCDGTELHLLDDEFHLLPGNFTSLQNIKIAYGQQRFSITGFGNGGGEVDLAGLLLARVAYERLYINDYEPCMVRSACTTKDGYTALAVRSSTVFSDFFTSPPYADLTQLNANPELSLYLDGQPWYIHSDGWPQQDYGEAEWDIAYSIGGSQRVTELAVRVSVQDAFLTNGFARLALSDGGRLLPINGGQYFVPIETAGDLEIIPDVLPDAGQLGRLRLAIMYDGGRFTSIDQVWVELEYSEACACAAPVPFCPGSMGGDQANSLTDLRNQIQGTNLVDIRLPTRLFRTQYCDGTEINVFQREMAIPKGGGLVQQKLDIRNTQQLFKVTLPSGQEQVMDLSQLIDLRKTTEGVSVEDYCGPKDGDPYDDPLDEDVTTEALDLSFYLQDHLGNTRVLFHTAFACGESPKYYLDHVVDYYPYGKVLREFAAGEKEKYLTTQHERDQETDLDYRGARFYDSDIARFLSLDPHAMKYPSLSDYNYVAGNPVILVDMDGRDFGIYVNHKDKTITIKQVYFTSGREVENQAFKAIKEFYESQNGKYGLQTEDAIYTIHYDIQMVPEEVGRKQRKNGETNQLWVVDKGPLGILDLRRENMGTSGKGFMTVAEQKILKKKEWTTEFISIHESLHTQGVSHSLIGKQGAFINEKVIAATLKFAYKVGATNIKVKKARTRWTLFRKVRKWLQPRVISNDAQELKGKIIKIKEEEKSDG